MCASLAVAPCISHIDVHTDRSTVVLMVLTFMVRPHILYLHSLFDHVMITNLQ